MTATYIRDLVAEKYAVTAKRSRLFIFLVIKPNGTVYEVDPVENTCTCCAGELGKPCCHRTQLQSLLRSESRRLLALSAEVEATDRVQALMLVAEVEGMVVQWKDVREARSSYAAAPPYGADGLRPASASSAFLTRFHLSERQIVRTVFQEGAAIKCEVSGILQHVSLTAQFELFRPGRYAHLSAWKRLRDLIETEPDTVAAYASAVLTERPTGIPVGGQDARQRLQIGGRA